MSEPQPALFGATLKAFRTQAKLSQFDLAVLLEWKGTTPIVLMEQGKRIPHLDTLARVCDALQLSYADRCYLSGLAGYGYITTLPPLSQIIAVLDQVDEEIRDLPYPAYVTDYRFRCWMANAAASMFVDGSWEALAALAAKGVTIFDLIFNSNLPPHRYSANREQIETEHLFRFKAHNLYRRHEPFYTAYPEVMRDRLTSADYERFAAKWAAVDALTMWQMFPRYVPIQMHIGDRILNLKMIEQPSLHLQHMFMFTHYQPDPDPANLELARAILQGSDIAGRSSVRVWELTGIDAWNNHSVTAPAPMPDV